MNNIDNTYRDILNNYISKYQEQYPDYKNGQVEIMFIKLLIDSTKANTSLFGHQCYYKNLDIDKQLINNLIYINLNFDICIEDKIILNFKSKLTFNNNVNADYIGDYYAKLVTCALSGNLADKQEVNKMLTAAHSFFKIDK